MSRRKQQAIEAATAAQVKQLTMAQNRWRIITSPTTLLVIGVIFLVGIGIVGAAASNSGKNPNGTEPGFGAWFRSSFSTRTGQPVVAPPPSATPQLSKEYVYAGGRLLTQEEIGATSSQTPPADLIVWRKSSGAWLIKDSDSGTTQTNFFGMDGDVTAPADFDGDGLTDFCVYRPNTAAQTGTWYIQPNGTTGFYGIQFGSHTDVPVPADYDGDGRADVAVWRNSIGQFIILQSTTNTAQFTSVGQAGATGQKPVPADFDGDGRADAAVWQSSTGNWTIRNTGSGQVQTVQFGLNGDSTVPGDYDGDGKFDQSVWRPGVATWYYKSSLSGATVYSQVLVTQAGDIAVPGDYDGDGKTDMAVWRPSDGYWKIQKSSTNTLRSDQWGATGDVPIAAPMKR